MGKGKKAKPAMNIQYYTPAQEVMAKEMSNRSPMKLGAVIEDVLGPPASDKKVEDVALEVINQHELSLSLSQWAVVQRMVEQGIRAGMELGRSAG